jgi:hypothetical protein
MRLIIYAPIITVLDLLGAQMFLANKSKRVGYTAHDRRLGVLLIDFFLEQVYNFFRWTSMYAIT